MNTMSLFSCKYKRGIANDLFLGSKYADIASYLGGEVGSFTED